MPPFRQHLMGCQMAFCGGECMHGLQLGIASGRDWQNLAPRVPGCQTKVVDIPQKEVESVHEWCSLPARVAAVGWFPISAPVECVWAPTSARVCAGLAVRNCALLLAAFNRDSRPMAPHFSTCTTRQWLVAREFGNPAPPQAECESRKLLGSLVR